ncbi:MAG: hypothetical protein IIT46_10615 [Lachnospiraceae bacterium]|nr:hypothetical protein [Lachnospiraceae bacterium]
MEMTIKQLADELGVSKTTISKAVLVLGFNGKLHKVGNRYMLSEMQILQIKSKISQFSLNDEKKKTQISPTLQTDEEKKTQISPTLQTDEEEKMQISLLKQQNAILQQQLSVLSKQLSVKDEQIKLLQEQLIAKDEQIGQITSAMESMATALAAEQALHAGTIQKQLTEHSLMDQPSDEEQSKRKQGIFSKLFGKKE